MTMRAREQAAQSGFSLLEMIVVMVIVSLVTSLLVAGIQHAYQIHARLGRHLQDARESRLAELWFRQSGSQLQAVPVDEDSRFKGFANRFAGLSLAAPDAPTGLPVPVSWHLVQDKERLVLEYRGDKGRNWPLAAWDGALGRFEYVDGQGKVHRRWPRPDGELEQLPRQIRLVIESRGAARQIWSVTILGGRLAKPARALLEPDNA